MGRIWTVRRVSLALLVGLSACTADESPTLNDPIQALTPGGESPGVEGPLGEMSSERYIVTLHRGVDPATVAREHRATPHVIYSLVLNGFAARLPEAARDGLLRDPRVERIEADAIVTIEQGQQGKGDDAGGSTLSWGLDRIDQRATRLDRQYTYEHTGAGVTAYVVDTGIRYDHEEFGGRAAFGFDVQRRGDGSDCHGHGTHVAGTLGGTTYGVAKAVELVSVRVLDCAGSGTLAGVIAGLDWIAANAERPAVANMSLGGGFSESLNDAVENLIAVGIPVAVAAGNGGTDGCQFSPASAPSAMTVGATEDTDTRAAFSNWGSCLDWFAPGVSITSAWLTSPSATKTASGTSMASPHTAGVAALYLETHPEATAAQIRNALFEFATKCIVQDARSDNWHLLFSLEEAAPWDCGTSPPPGEPVPPTNVSATATTDYAGAKIHWDNRAWYDGADTYELVWRVARTTWPAEAQQSGFTGASHNSTLGVGILEPATTYEFRVRVGYPGYDIWSVWSETVSATTCDTKGKSGKCR